MSAPPGATVALTYDYHAELHCTAPPGEDDYLVSWSERTERWGSAYLIRAVRKVRSELHPHRYSLCCLKLGAVTEVPADATVYPIVWYPRTKRRRPR